MAGRRPPGNRFAMGTLDASLPTHDDLCVSCIPSQALGVPLRSPLTRSLALVAAAALATAFASTAPADAAPSSVTIPGTAPTQPAGASSSAVPGSQRLSFSVQLKMRDAAAAERLATTVSAPGSASYGHYLSPAQFNARFAPTVQQVGAVSAYLSSAGIAVGSVPGNRRFVPASGTAAQIRTAFGVQLRDYTVGGKTVLDTDRAATLPASLASDVLTVTGLNTGVRARPGLVGRDRVGAAGPAGRTSAPRHTIDTPCSTFWAQHSATMPPAYGQRTGFPTAICGYDADQLRGAYGLTGPAAVGRDGRGTTIAIVDAYNLPTMRADANRYFRSHGERPFAGGQYRTLLPSSYSLQNVCGAPGWNTEQALDVETVHGVAPGADVLYVAGRSCSYDGLIDPLNTIVNGHLADLISNSWGFFGESTSPASVIAATHQVLVQAAAEGIGSYFCDLDNGDTLANGSGVAEPVYPASDPMTTGIGGTSLAVGAGNGYDFETGWGNTRAGVTYSADGTPTGYYPALPGTFYIGTGGGVSSLFTQPAYQRGVVPAALSRQAGGRAMRVEPDLSADADPYTGYALGYTDPTTGQWTTPTYGGTSLATPIIAAVIAIGSQGRRTPVGFANPLLYSIRRGAAVHDVRPTAVPVAVAFTSSLSTSLCYQSCLITEDRDTTLRTTYGYDDVTGLGSPHGRAFLDAVRTG